jgi:hypothetical protein
MYYLPGRLAKLQQLAFSLGIPSFHRKPKALEVQPQSPALEIGRVHRSQRQKVQIIPQFPQVAESQGEPQPSPDTAQALVRRFYSLRYGHEQEPTERELQEAKVYVQEGEGWGAFLVEYSATQGKKVDGFPNEFGGIKKLVSQATELFEEQRKKRASETQRKASKSHEGAHQPAYHAFLLELLNGGLESTLPGVFVDFDAEEKRAYRFHKGKAEKSSVSAQIVGEFYSDNNRIHRLLKFIDDNPKSGIPNFWQWDDKINTAAVDQSE